MPPRSPGCLGDPVELQGLGRQGRGTTGAGAGHLEDPNLGDPRLVDPFRHHPRLVALSYQEGHLLPHHLEHHSEDPGEEPVEGATLVPSGSMP